MRPYTLLFYCGRDDDPFMRRPSFASYDEAIGEAQALRLRALKPATDVRRVVRMARGC